MAVVNEIVTKFGFQGTAGPLEEYNQALGSSISLVATASAGIMLASGAVAAFTIATTSALSPMIQLGRQSEVSAETIQELGFVASVTGSSVQALESTIGNMSQKIGEAAQRGSEDFSRLGISVRNAAGEVKTADDLLMEVSGRFQTMDLSMREQQDFAQRLGIDQSLIQMLNLTGDEMDGLRQRAVALGRVTQEQADAAEELNINTTTARFAMQGLRNQIAVSLAPQISDITNRFISFMEANRDLIAEGISVVVEFIQVMAATIVRLAPIIIGVIALFGLWKIATIGLGTVLGIVFSPVVLITAAIVALMLIVDDLIVAMSGGQSVIADFFEEFFGIDIVAVLRTAYEFIVEFASRVWRIFSPLFDLLGAAWGMVVSGFRGDWDAFVGYFMRAVNAIGEFFKRLGDTLIDAFFFVAQSVQDSFAALFDWLRDTFPRLFSFFSKAGDTLSKYLVDPIRNAFELLFSYINGAMGAILGAVDRVKGFFGGGSDDEQSQVEPQQMIGPENIMRIVNEAGNNRVDQDIDIHIMTSDPRAAGESVRGGLQDQLQDAQTQLDRGGM